MSWRSERPAPRKGAIATVLTGPRSSAQGPIVEVLPNGEARVDLGQGRRAQGPLVPAAAPRA